MLRRHPSARTAAERRLATVARQWLPSSPEIADARGPLPEIRVRGWSRAAVRSLAIVMAAACAVAAYWAWTGRPRDAVAVPVSMLASGVPIAVPARAAGSAAAASTMPVASRAATTAAAPGPAASPPATAQAPIVVVHVIGAVRRPGLVRLPAGSRVADAIAAAGGTTRPRAADTVNLARVLVDGEQIPVAVPGAAAAAAGGPAAAATPVDLNTVDAAGLDALPGVGPVLAGRILQWRTANGPFRSVDELGEVSGIGDAILAQLRPLVRV